MRTLLIRAGDRSPPPLDQLLRDRGHEVICCEGAGPGLAALAAEPLDLVIVDLGLPGIDFSALARSLRDSPRGAWLVILVISASDQRGDIDEAVRSGADDYLVPTDEPDLLGIRLTIAERRVKDNDARLRMMSALTESEGRFRDLLETAPDAIFQIDLDGRIRLVNGHAERMSGYCREDLIGQPVELLVPEAHRGAHTEHRRRFAERPSTRPMGTGISLYLQRKDGSQLSIDICLGHHRANGQEYTIAAVRDITERRRLEDELRLANEAAERAYERIRRDMEGRRPAPTRPAPDRPARGPRHQVRVGIPPVRRAGR